MLLVTRPDTHTDELTFLEEDDEDSGFRSEMPTLIDPIEVGSIPISTRTPKNRALLTVLTGPEKGAIHRLQGTSLTIGRSDEATICIPDQGLSRVHARLERTGDAFLLSDAGSTNGTYLDDFPVTSPVRIGSGARIRLGTRTLVSISFHDELEEEAALSVYEAALRDRLTGVYNRGVFEDRLAAEVAFAKRHRVELSLLLFDIDHFKFFNDTYGHQAGDAVLVCVGGQVLKTVRTEDIVARYGGEEFAVIARSTPREKAIVLGERIRAAVAAAVVDSKGKSLQVTASVGIATLSATSLSPQDGPSLVAEADRALYAAKDRGRNCVVHAARLVR